MPCCDRIPVTVVDGRLTAGDFLLIQAYMAMLFGPLIWLGSTWGEIVAALTNLEQVMELYATSPQVTESPNAVDLVLDSDHIRKGRFGQICFDNVSFHYSKVDKSDPLLYSSSVGGIYNVSFNVEPGKTIALCGATGSGKVCNVAVIAIV